jgi:DMSO/TMAO reductase YedYZ molybdopterin-dependent catalytic subunit
VVRKADRLVADDADPAGRHDQADQADHVETAPHRRDRLRARLGQLTAVLSRPLAPPPEALRRGPFKADAFGSTLRSERLTSQLGVLLGAAFLICFATGYLSHAIQHPPGWFWWPSRPVELYRVTQGVHVATGIAIVPLLGAKLWSVYPKLFVWPPARNLAHAAERASVAVLVAGALFQVISGILNLARWYGPMPFFFTTAHYAGAWLAIGALLVHIGVQLPVIRRALTRESTVEPVGPGLSRRGLIATVGATSGLLTLATVGQTVPWLGRLSVLAPRRPTTGPQHLPVNKSAVRAGVIAAATDPAYRLDVVGPGGSLSLSRDDLAALPQHRVSLPISCVEGWSADAVWTGVRLADLAARVGGGHDSQVMVESLEAGGRYRASVVAPPHVRDPLTLVAVLLRGEPLALDHGYPCRLIGPNRPGVMQTKWLSRITVSAG